VIILDKMLIGGIKFVLTRIASAVDAEMNSEEGLREELLAAQMKLELGDIDEDEFAKIETALLTRMREIRAARGESEASPSNRRVTGIEASVHGEHDDEKAG
jgi:hypothetical protein